MPPRQRVSANAIHALKDALTEAFWFKKDLYNYAKAAVGGVAAAAIGDPAVFVSVDAMHQGPQGGGPCIAIIDAGE